MAKGLLLLSLCWLLACSSPPQRLLEDYLARVARVTDTAAPDLQMPPLPAWPPVRALRLAVPEQRTGWLGFLRLRDCQLDHLVGQRNSVLGRVATPSQRLLYEWRLLQGLQRCEAQLQVAPEPDAEFLAEISALLVSKRAAFPAVFWNATLAADELRKAHTLATEALPLEAQESASLSALAWLAALGERLDPATVAADIDSTALEQQFFALQLHERGGRLLQAQALLTAYLNAVAEVIERRFARRPLCFAERPSSAGRVLQTVLIKVYAGRVQPYLADVSRQWRAWRMQLNALAEAQVLLRPPAWQAYQQQLNRLEAGLIQASTGHMRAWQRILQHCGLRAGAPPPL